MNPVRVSSGVVLVLLLALAWASWLLRYEIHTVSGQEGYALAYRLDRWTGEVRLLDDDQWYPVVEGNPEDLRAAPSSAAFSGAGRLRQRALNAVVQSFNR
jgi:hypothetical protein